MRLGPPVPECDASHLAPPTLAFFPSLGGAGSEERRSRSGCQMLLQGLKCSPSGAAGSFAVSGPFPHAKGREKAPGLSLFKPHLDEALITPPLGRLA